MDLGFVGRTLYLYSEYFEDKPIDHILGRTLDKLFSIGVTELFTKIALKAMKTLDIKVKSLHLDSTSFHVDGNYHSLLEQEESRIQLIQGYSRDHRPDLNQTVLQMITSNQGNIPLFMQAASGNSSDKTAFSEIVAQHAKSFQSAYADVPQRWVVIFSEAAYQRENKTLDKNYKKGSEKEAKEFTKLTKEVFSCNKDALKHYEKAVSKYKYLEIHQVEIVEVQKHPTVGRPKKGSLPLTKGYQIRGCIACSLSNKQLLERSKGYSCDQ